ncbi:hypothetical protein SUGI_1201760 [Cryptomeria japonica]|nr:hypothetical protein SUGI_1201760 [Cryptomeria japonica]
MAKKGCSGDQSKELGRQYIRFHGSVGQISWHNRPSIAKYHYQVETGHHREKASPRLSPQFSDHFQLQGKQ